MKNLFRYLIIALTIATSVIACKGKKSSNSADSAKTDSSSVSDTTRHADTTLKVDTVKPATDTSDMKTDTVSKTVKSETVVKKLDVKKGKPADKQK